MQTQEEKRCANCGLADCDWLYVYYCEACKKRHCENCPCVADPFDYFDLCGSSSSHTESPYHRIFLFLTGRLLR